MHDETLRDDLTRVGADELYPSREFSLVEFRHFFKGFLEFLMETIRFSRDCINTFIIPKLGLILFSI